MPSSDALEVDFERALDEISVPSYVVDATGVIRWLNEAARRLSGDVHGRQFTSVVAPEETLRSRELFARSIVGSEPVTEAELVIVGADGERVTVEVSSVPLVSGGRVIGVFGQVFQRAEAPSAPQPNLTSRQAEVLRLLERGCSTQQIARELHLSRETVRNHIRHVLRALGAHSRLEAVAAARRAGTTS